MNSVSEQKSELRRTLRCVRSEVENRTVKSAAACARLAEIPGWNEARCVLAYVNYRSELETDALLETLWDSPVKRCVLPLCLPEGGLRLVEVRSRQELAPGMYGIQEPRADVLADSERTVCPEMLDFAVLPGVGFDVFGGRLGQGGGYYDRLLPQIRPETPTAGLAFASQILTEPLPRETHDLRVKYVVSEEKIWKAPELRVVGILGGIASGKSLVSAFFREKGVPVFDADREGHALYENSEIRTELLARWGNRVLASDGTFDRKKIASLVFAPSSEGSESPELTFLNALFHPEIHRRWEIFRDSALYSGHSLVILDAALLLESGWGKECGELLFVETPRERQISFALSRSWTLEELERREKNQFSLEKKRSSASRVVRNDGTPEELHKKLTEMFF